MRPSIAQLGGSSRISARSVTLLPEPDSPRMPSTSPRASRKLTPLTAWTVRSRCRKRTARSIDLDRRRAAHPAALAPSVRLWPEPATIMWQAT